MGARTHRTATNERPQRRKGSNVVDLPNYQELREPKTKAEVFKPANKAQERYIHMMENNTVTFGIGPAGTGKSYVAAYVAATMLQNKQIDRIIITRPAVEAGKSIGFLPGEMDEKFGPFVAPFMEALGKMLGKGHVEALMQNNKIVMLPLGFSRGWTFERAFVVLEEAQNTTKAEMKLFLTRIGNDTKCVVDGDLDQKDGDFNGLHDAIWRFKRTPSIGIHRFTEDDIVRSGVAKAIVKGYSDDYDPDADDREGLETFLSK